MKKKFIIIYLLYLSIITGYIFINIYTPQKDTVSTQVYYIDSDMLRLVPTDLTVAEKKPQKQAEIIISKLIDGKDNVKKIKRMIPKNPACMSVQVNFNTAIVDIKKAEEFPDGRVAEGLVVYQIVNSLTSIEGIDEVKFTINGETSRDFKGFMDMRETYIADLYV